jgi:hypothetical protein
MSMLRQALHDIFYKNLNLDGKTKHDIFWEKLKLCFEKLSLIILILSYF